jgi:hypothetical protein
MCELSTTRKGIMEEGPFWEPHEMEEWNDGMVEYWNIGEI